MDADFQMGMQLTIAGMSIVFIVLAGIALLITLFRSLDRKWEKREADQKQAMSEKPVSIDNITLVLISAAVATYLTGRFRIRSIHRVESGGIGGSPWTSRGRVQLLGSHLLPKKPMGRF
ncbi:OadG family protein [bacterium]|nr:OadG family protein [candidate division CSSED10-310 bacterium]